MTDPRPKPHPRSRPKKEPSKDVFWMLKVALVLACYDLFKTGLFALLDATVGKP